MKHGLDPFRICILRPSEGPPSTGSCWEERRSRRARLGGGFESPIVAADKVAFLPEVQTPFAGLAAVIYAPIVGKLVESVLGNLRELGVSATVLRVS